MSTVTTHRRAALRLRSVLTLAAAAALAIPTSWCAAQVAVRGEVVHTMAGPPIRDGVVLVEEGRIVAVGPASEVAVPAGWRELRAAVVTPGLVDAHSVVGLAGQYNHDHDQDQLEHSDPIQPELRAVDSYNTRERLVEWIRSFGVTTVHTGHAPGELVSGQTIVVKTAGNTVDEALLVPFSTVAATLGPAALRPGDGARAPGTRSKAVSMLRQRLIDAQAYALKHARHAEADGGEPAGPPPARDLELEALSAVLNGEVPLLVTANRVQDIASALRMADEFDIRLILDGASESYLLLDEIRAAGVPVIVHPTMQRAYGETENLSFETASALVGAGIPVALQSGYESYVPKTRVVLFEAGVAAANGLTFEQALRTITLDAARILGVDDRVGSLERGKDADLALYDGDPFEYTSHCVGVLVNGELVHDTPR